MDSQWLNSSKQNQRRKSSTMSETNQFSNNHSQEWWDAQAKENPINAGVLSVFGMNRLSREFRPWRERYVFTQMVPSWKGKRVLEIGCGAGRWAFWLANEAAEVVAIDFSTEMIRLANERCVKEGRKNLIFSVCAAQDYISSTPFDLIYLSGVDQYLTDAEMISLVTHCDACLIPYGTLVDRVTISLGQTQPIEKESGYQCIYRNEHDLLKFFHDAGFECTDRRPSHEKPRLEWAARHRRMKKYLESIMKRSPALGCRLVLYITKCLDFIWPLKDEASRSHDFLVFSRRGAKIS